MAPVETTSVAVAAGIAMPTVGTIITIAGVVLVVVAVVAGIVFVRKHKQVPAAPLVPEVVLIEPVDEAPGGDDEVVLPDDDEPAVVHEEAGVLTAAQYLTLHRRQQAEYVAIRMPITPLHEFEERVEQYVLVPGALPSCMTCEREHVVYFQHAVLLPDGSHLLHLQMCERCSHRHVAQLLAVWADSLNDDGLGHTRLTQEYLFHVATTRQWLQCACGLPSVGRVMAARPEE